MGRRAPPFGTHQRRYRKVLAPALTLAALAPATIALAAPAPAILALAALVRAPCAARRTQHAPGDGWGLVLLRPELSAPPSHPMELRAYVGDQ